MHIDNIHKPSLVLDESKCRCNIRFMAQKAMNSNVLFRPHFKTHQSATIGTWFKDEGIQAITVSSVTMASFFSNHGWHDITIAFPLNFREIDEVKKLAEKSQINLLTASYEHLEILTKKVKFDAGCFIEIDTGYKRSGVEWNDYEQLMRMVDIINENNNLRIKGFLFHAGHTYSAQSPEEIISIYGDSLLKTKEIKKRITFPGLIFSAGDTPSCSVVEDLSGIDEIRPGNFVFYDLMQHQLGSCRKEDIALAVYCPVIDINYKRNEVLIYGGAVHLSKESITIGENGKKIFGEVAFLAENGWVFPEERIFVKSITQEHGILSVPGKLIRKFKRGELVAVIPVHSCLTVDLLRKYHTLDGRIINDLSPK